MADQPSVTLPATVEAVHGEIVTIEAVTAQKNIVWILPDGLCKHRIPGFEASNKLVLSPHSDGTHTIYAYTALADVPSAPAKCVLTVKTEESAPAPLPIPTLPIFKTLLAAAQWLQAKLPAIITVLALLAGGGLMATNMPGCQLPIPIPVPPGPGPTPPPIPTNGLSVLIVYDEMAKASMPKAQAEILTAGDLRAYLQSHCAVGADGKTKEFRILDKDTDLSNEAPLWQGAMKLPRASLPWIYVSNGKTGTSEPLPADVNMTLALLKKFGGA